MIWGLLFVGCIGLVLYSYAVYPAVMMLLGKSVRKQAKQQPSQQTWPSVDVIVAAHDEERHIGARVHNLLGQAYPAALLKVLIGSDGSTDRTVPIVESLRSARVRVFSFEKRRGKASVINDLVKASAAEILVFTDANTIFDYNAVEHLVRCFADPAVGAVCGELKLVPAGRGHNQDSTYWAFETAVKAGESHLNALLGANGGIYAIRRSLFQPIPADTIIDDFTIAMNVAIQGSRLVFEPAALAFEEAPSDIRDEFRRRIRIGVGNYQALFRYPAYWSRVSAVRRLAYFSHKIVRWFAPHLLLLAFVASMLAVPRAIFGPLLLLQALGYAVLTIGLLSERFLRLPRLLSAPLFLFALNVAFMIGFYRYLTGPASGQWRRTARA